MAEIKLYGDVVLRLVGEDHFEGAFLPNFEDIRPPTEDGHVGAGVGRYGIERFDHIVGNVWSLPKTLSYMRNITVSTVLQAAATMLDYPSRWLLILLFLLLLLLLLC
jgi:hypothetical protein